jgi:HicA toxin of bacterial toxin-antitoxin,
MAKKSLQACKTHDEIVSYAQRNGCTIQNGGRHTKIIGPQGGMVPVPRHPGDLAKGTRFSIIKMLALLLPIVVAVIAALVS